MLRFEQHQATTRPGEGGLFRRRHLVHVAHLPPVAARVAAVELDAEDDSEVLWLAPADLAGAHLYPDLGAHLADTVAKPGTVLSAPVLLPAMSDATYRWR